MAATDSDERERLALCSSTQTSDDRHYQIDNSGHITLTAARHRGINNDFETTRPTASLLSVQAGDAAGNWSATPLVTVNVTNVNKRPAWCLPTPQKGRSSRQRRRTSWSCDANGSDGQRRQPHYALTPGSAAATSRVLRNRPGHRQSLITAAGAAQIQHKRQTYRRWT